MLHLRGADYAKAPRDRPGDAWVGKAPQGRKSIANVARQAKIETSVTHPDYSAKGATDGKAGGYPDDIKQEWASFGWGEGAWIKLTWEKPQTVSRVWLVDRPNPTDQITGGTLQFSDGTSIEIEKPLPDNGAKGLEINFEPKTITSLTFKVTKVKQKPCNIGLSEIAVFALPPLAEKTK